MEISDVYFLQTVPNAHWWKSIFWHRDWTSALDMLMTSGRCQKYDVLGFSKLTGTWFSQQKARMSKHALAALLPSSTCFCCSALSFGNPHGCCCDLIAWPPREIARLKLLQGGAKWQHAIWFWWMRFFRFIQWGPYEWGWGAWGWENRMFFNQISCFLFVVFCFDLQAIDFFEAASTIAKTIVFETDARTISTDHSESNKMKTESSQGKKHFQVNRVTIPSRIFFDPQTKQLTSLQPAGS